MTTPVTLQGNLATVTFRPPFDIESYRLFLRCKALPENQVDYDDATDAYTVSTPARFAGLLGVAAPDRQGHTLPLASYLRDYQQWVIRLALDAKRFAAWLDTGLGKMAVSLEFSRQVMALTDARVLIFVPTIELIDQYQRETTTFYGDSLPLCHLEHREDLVAWCQRPGAALGITTYAKLDDGPIPELRYLAGVVADEGSMLKTKGGSRKWALMHSAQGVEYKLVCTATPAPNNPEEYWSQAGFLERIRHGNTEIWSYFVRKGNDWVIKPHAKSAFYRWMASWSVYMRDPAAFGFGDLLSTLPPPDLVEAALPMTDEQRELMFAELSRAGVGMLADDRLPMPLRIKLAQIARGFLYEDGAKRARRLPSYKVDYVVEAVRTDVQERGQTLVWTVFDEESDILQERLSDAPFPVAALHGRLSDRARSDVLRRYLAGDVACLISKPSLIGYGLNLQNTKAMIFSGIDDSYERLYQAIRRAVRPGQTDRVRVRTPYIRELEGVVYDNVRAKETRHLEEVALQERHYRTAYTELQEMAA